MKKLIFILSLIFTSQLYAFQYVKGSTTVFANLLGWTVREGGDEDWGEIINQPGNNISEKNLQAAFNWNTGFRIGIGYNNSNDWDSVLYYTSYQTKATSQVTAPAQIYSPYLGNFFAANNTLGANNGPFYNSASLIWRFAFNTLDFELGRSFKIDKILTIRPFLGIKGAVINQKIYTNWQGPNTLNALGTTVPITSFTSASENLTQDFTGIGPSFGVNTTWPVYKISNGSFNLFGNFSAALLYGVWRFTQVYQNDAPSSVTTLVDDVHGVAPVTRAFVGIEWAGTFPNVDANVRLGYEGQVWFDQMQLNSLNGGRLNDIMSLQGGVLDFSFKF